MRVRDLDIDELDYQRMLNAAMENASSKWEREFVGNQEYKFDEYGANAYVSEKQLEILEKLSGWSL